MNCVRREAGAHRPAASTPAGSARPDPRSGRRRARLSLLPPVLALLLGAPGLFAAAPAQAQTTIWSATMTVDGEDGGFATVERGCSNVLASIDNCSRVLTDDDFTIQGTTFAVDILVVEIKPDPGDEGLYLQFAGIDGSAAKTALEALGSMVLHVDDLEYAVSNAQISGSFLIWPRSWRTHWLDGQKVKLRLTVPAGVPGKPGAFRLRAGDGQVAMHYTCGVDYYGKCQYRQKAGTNAWGSWTDIPESRSGGVNRGFVDGARPEQRHGVPVPAPRGEPRGLRPRGRGGSGDARGGSAAVPYPLPQGRAPRRERRAFLGPRPPRRLQHHQVPVHLHRRSRATFPVDRHPRQPRVDVEARGEESEGRGRVQRSRSGR